MTLTQAQAADTITPLAAYETRTRRWSRAEYEKLADPGVLGPGEAIELISGELLVAEPQGWCLAPYRTPP